jgi:chemotaxis protein MotA
MFVIIGYVIILACVLGGFLLAGGHIGVLIQPVEILIIGGAALGAFIAGNSMQTIKATLSGATGTLKSNRYNKDYFVELLVLFNDLSQKTRREGLLALEAVAENPSASGIFGDKILKDHHMMEFMTDNLRMLIIGVEVYQFEELMDQAIEIHHEVGHAPIKAVQRVGDGMPAFGIVAAVMGVVHTMESVGIPPAELGKLIAAALVGTFLGILLAYGFVGPVAGVMEERLEDAGNAYKCVKKGLLNIANGTSPAMTVEFMRSGLPSETRPGFEEMETLLKSR